MTKRIGIIINGLSGGGAERVVCTLANHWAQTGQAEVFILSMSGENAAFTLHKRVRVDSIWPGAEKSGFSAALRSWSAAAAIDRWRTRHGIEESISFLQRANFANVLACSLGSNKQIRTVISQRNVVTFAYPKLSPSGIFGRLLIKRLYNQANQIVCNSPGVADSLGAIGVRRDLCAVVGNPQNLEEIRLASEQGESRLWRSNRKLRLIAVGRLIEQKAYDILIPALGKLAAQVDFECLILGRGPLQSALERQRDRAGLTNHITFYGWVDNPFTALAESDIFLLPSRWEGFGNVLLEAMALGKPIVAADCPGSPRWLLQAGESGFLFKNEDFESLYQVLEPLATDQSMRDEYGHRAARRAEDFSVARMADQYFQVLFPEKQANRPAAGPEAHQSVL